jgi:hypothetical protein
MKEGAQVMTLQGKNHFMLPGESAAIQFRKELELFLRK